LKQDLLNYFHDWVSTRLSFSKDLVLVVEIMTEDEKVHSATLTFVGYSKLEFKDYAETPLTETENLEKIKKLSLDRWIQESKEIDGGIEIQFIGGNDFTDSAIGTLSFDYKSILVTINGEECPTESAIEKVLSQIMDE